MSLARRGWMLLLMGACVAAERDAVNVLARFGEIVRGNASRIPNFTCVETIERQYYRARLTTTPRNCDDLAAERKRRGYKLTLEGADRLRLDVRAGITAEMYSWPGANRFEDRDLWDIIGYGPSASGPFAASLLEVVQGDATDFAFLDETESGGRKLFQYSFRVPAERSHYFIYMPQGTVATAWDGTLLLDPETSELARMTTRTSELPPEALACELTTASDYGRVSLGGREFPLSRETRQRFIDRSGDEVENIVTFSACREYQAESRVSFGSAPEDAPAGPAKADSAPRLDLPAGLPVIIALTAGIDSATAAGGDRFTGRLAKPVLDDRKRTLAPEGSVVAGRLIKVAVRMQPPEVAIVLNVETVRIDGAEVAFHVAGRTPSSRSGEWLRDILSSLTIGAGGSHSGGSASGITITDHPPAPEGELNALRFPGTRKVLEPGFKTEWVTVKP
jgi:hypothetical protein